MLGTQMQNELPKPPESREYAYESLEHASSHIRLLTLFPSCKKTTPLRGELRTMAITEMHIYEALSYVWGNQVVSSYLWVDGGRLSLSSNLNQALMHLRHPKEPRTIWIDAVCINQGDLEEKSHQVQQMYKIFAAACRVVIWLGESDADSDYAMENFGSLHSPDVDFIRVGKIFDRPWWTRMWTLQEGLVVNKDSLALCGSKYVPWDTIIQDISFLLRGETVQRIGMLPVDPVLQYFFRIRSLRKNAREVALEDLVFMSIGRQASDPRDNIFALLGLLTQPSLYGLTPDYSEPALWTYQKTMIGILKSQGNLDFLLCKLYMTESSELSWCVDFSRRHGLAPFDPDSLYYRYGSMSKTGATTGRETATLSHNIYTGQLTLSGVVVGIVNITEQISQRTTQLIPEVERRLIVHKQERGYSIHCDIATFLDGMLAISALCLHNWKIRLGSKAARSKLDLGDAWMLAAGGRTFQRLMNKYPDEVREGYRVMADLAKHGVKQLLERSLRVPNAEVQHAMLGYRRIYGYYGVNAHFFGTDTNYVGSGSETINAGDCLCIVFGCKLPLILRPCRAGTYRIITSAYVDGIMNGEFLESRTGDIDTKFVIE